MSKNNTSNRYLLNNLIKNRFMKNMYSIRPGILCIAFTIIATMSQSATAGIIPPSNSDSDYTDLANESRFAPVGEIIINGGSSQASGTVINNNFVLTSAHVLDGANSVTFSVDGSSYTTTEWIIHHQWTGNFSNGHDIALVKFAGGLGGASVANLWTGGTSLTGMEGINVGFGKSGTAVTGAVNQSGTKRAGKNNIDLYSGGQLYQDFDDLNNADGINFLGTSNQLGLEYLIAGGDSGGGLFIESGGTTYLAGIHSYVADNNGNNFYNDITISTSVSDYSSWISSNTVAVPEPSSFALMGMGLAGFAFTVLKRRKA